MSLICVEIPAALIIYLLAITGGGEQVGIMGGDNGWVQENKVQ